MSWHGLCFVLPRTTAGLTQKVNRVMESLSPSWRIEFDFGYSLYPKGVVWQHTTYRVREFVWWSIEKKNLVGKKTLLRRAQSTLNKINEVWNGGYTRVYPLFALGEVSTILTIFPGLQIFLHLIFLLSHSLVLAWLFLKGESMPCSRFKSYYAEIKNTVKPTGRDLFNPIKIANLSGFSELTASVWKKHHSFTEPSELVGSFHAQFAEQLNLVVRACRELADLSICTRREFTIKAEHMGAGLSMFIQDLDLSAADINNGEFYCIDSSSLADLAEGLVCCLAEPFFSDLPEMLQKLDGVWMPRKNRRFFLLMENMLKRILVGTRAFFSAFLFLFLFLFYLMISSPPSPGNFKGEKDYIGHMLLTMSNTPFNTDESALDLLSFMFESNTLRLNRSVFNFHQSTVIADDHLDHDFKALATIFSTPRTYTTSMYYLIKSFDAVKNFSEAGNPNVYLVFNACLLVVCVCFMQHEFSSLPLGLSRTRIFAEPVLFFRFRLCTCWRICPRASKKPTAILCLVVLTHNLGKKHWGLECPRSWHPTPCHLSLFM